MPTTEPNAFARIKNSTNTCRTSHEQSVRREELRTKTKRRRVDVLRGTAFRDRGIEIARRVRNALAAESAVLSFRIGGNELSCVSTADVHDATAPESLPRGDCPMVDYVLETGEGIRVRDLYAQDGTVPFAPAPPREHQSRATSVVAVPIIAADGSTIGVLHAVNSANGEFSAQDEERLRKFALSASSVYAEPL